MALRRSPSKVSTDSDTLALLGKKQVLKRRFGFWSLLAFAVCELITWETVLALFSEAFENGGPAGAIYGYIIAWSSTLSVYIVISELASMAPIACGQYFWVYMLAPTNYKKIASYMIGWLTTLAWVATIATESLFAGLIVQGIVTLQYPGYDAKMWQGTLLTFAVIFVNICINVFGPGLLPKFEILVMIFHIGGFIGIMVALLTTAEIGTAESVWLTTFNEGGWPTQGLSYCVGFLGNVATFVGADASVHLAEEVENAATTIPRAIVTAMLVNGALGFAMMITTLYSLGDAQSVLDSKTGFPFIQIFFNSTNTIKGAVAMSAIVLFLTWVCALGITTTASRMAWSFARDRGVPFSKFFSRVSSRTRVPVPAILAVTILAGLLTCIYIGSSVAFNDVISLTITGFYGSYLLPCGLLLYHRIKGNVLPHSVEHEILQETDGSPSDEPITEEKKERREEQVAAATSEQHINDGNPDAKYVWGPWHIPGVIGTINNAYACCYMVFVIFWSVWPPATPVDAESMNYSVVVTGGVLILSAIWYWVRARKVYEGPLVEDEVRDLAGGRRGSITQV